MTEEEAKERWCPFARLRASDFPAEGNHAANRTDTGLPIGTCIGSQCMAWRGLDTREVVVGNEIEVLKGRDLPPLPEGADRWRHQSLSLKAERLVAIKNELDGYCGLAGKQ